MPLNTMFHQPNMGYPSNQPANLYGATTLAGMGVMEPEETPPDDLFNNFLNNERVKSHSESAE